MHDTLHLTLFISLLLLFATAICALKQQPPVSSMFRIKSAWSLAGVGTSIVIDVRDNSSAPKPSTRIVFDCGTTPIIEEAFPSKTVIISHGHVDHFGGIFNHARAHSVVYGGSTPTYYVPSALVPKLEQAREVISSIDAMSDGSEGSRAESMLKMNIVGVNAGDEIPLNCKKMPGGAQIFLRAFAVDHCGHPALGYTIVSRQSPGLKPEYQGLPGKEIGALVKSGVQVKADPTERLEVTYTGDTSYEGILKTQENDSSSSSSCSDVYRNQAFAAPLILCEATFLDPEMTDLSKKRGHMNIHHIPQVLASHGWGTNEDLERKLVLFHVSSRYRPAKRALDMMLRYFPASVVECCDVAISSLLSEDEKQASDTTMVDLIQTNGCLSLKEYKCRQDISKEES